MILGDLEKEVLRYLWSVDGDDAKGVHKITSKNRKGTINTVQSTLERLFKKKLLSREKRGHSYFYKTKVSKEKLLSDLFIDAAQGIDSDGNSIVAAFASMTKKLDEQEVTKLEALILAHKKKKATN